MYFCLAGSFTNSGRLFFFSCLRTSQCQLPPLNYDLWVSPSSLQSADTIDRCVCRSIGNNLSGRDGLGWIRESAFIFNQLPDSAGEWETKGREKSIVWQSQDNVLFSHCPTGFLNFLPKYLLAVPIFILCCFWSTMVAYFNFASS